MKMIHITVALYLSDDADVDQVVAEMDYHFEYENQIKNMEVVNVKTDFEDEDAQMDWSYVENADVLRVLNGSKNYFHLQDAVYATESMSHSDPAVDAEIERLWVEAESQLGDNDDVVAENLKKIWTLLKPE
jgi:hypothetical protein